MSEPTAPTSAARRWWDRLRTAQRAEVEVISFGYLHAPAPQDAHITVDVRAHIRDPHISPALRELTAREGAVRQVVLATPGVPELIAAAAEMVRAYAAGTGAAVIRVAVGCSGGRHRAPTIAAELAARISEVPGHHASVTHRDIETPVLDR